MSYHRRYKVKDDRFGLLALSLREKAGLTQSEMAASVGVSERTIRHWEAGTAYPDVAHLKKLIELYLLHAAFSREHARDEAKTLWEQVAESASRRKASFDDNWFDALLQQQTSYNSPLERRQLASPSSTHMLPHRTDWGEAIDVATFCGREHELAELERWIGDEHCRMVMLLGMGGIGKTTLSIRFAQHMTPHFDFVLWRSLYNAPPLQELLTDCIQALSEQHITPGMQNEDKTILLLVELLRKRRCLLVLDNVETLLQTGSLEGGYRPGYKGYGVLFRRVAEMSHQSCILLTSREMLSELEPLEGRQAAVRILKLGGLEQAASQQLLKDKDLVGSQSDWEQLVQRYSGNPLALKIVAATVRDLFGGDIAAFVHEGAMNLHTLRQLLHQQTAQLTTLELGILYWLAIERELVPLELLHKDFVGILSMSELLIAIKSLRRRCLIERGERAATFTLQPEVMEYASERLVEQMSEEVLNANPDLLLSHALMKAQSNDDIRESQERMLVRPVLNRLLKHFGDERKVAQQLRLLSCLLREKPMAAQGYGGGNLVHLLTVLQGHLRQTDFSALAIRQADLTKVEAQDADFRGAAISDSLFMEPVGSISAMALSPDGRYLAVGSINGHISVWRVADKTLLLTLYGHNRLVWALTFSPDSTMLASGGYDKTIKLWTIEGERDVQGRCLKTLTGHTKWIRSLAFSVDGSRLASSGDDEIARVWDVREGTCLHMLRGHSGCVWSVAISSDGSRLISAGDDAQVRIWDMREGTCLHVLHRHSGAVMSLACQPMGTMFASGGEDGSIHIWDILSGRHITTLQLSSKRAMSIAFNPEGTLLASGSFNGEVEVWHIPSDRTDNTPSRLRTLPGHPIWVGTISFGPNNLLASISYSGQVKFWDVESGRCLGSIQGYSHIVCTLAFSPDGCLLVHGDDHGTMRVWDVASGRCLTSFRAHDGRIWSVQFSADGTMLASGGDDHVTSVKLWNVEQTQRRISDHPFRTLYGQITMVWSLAFSADARMVASSGYDLTPKFWTIGRKPQTEQLIILDEHHTFIWSVAFSPDGRMLASGDNDGIIKVWDTARHECLATLQHHSAAIGALVFSSDGKTLFSSDTDGNMLAWSMGDMENMGNIENTGTCSTIVQGQEPVNWTKAMTFNRNGSMLALGYSGHRIKLWQKGEDHPRILSNPDFEGGQVWSLAFSPDERLLASGDDDGNLMLWDIASGNVCQTLHSDRPYERMNISGVKGITQAQRDTLKALGAIEGD